MQGIYGEPEGGSGGGEGSGGGVQISGDGGPPGPGLPVVPVLGEVEEELTGYGDLGEYEEVTVAGPTPGTPT